MSELPNISPVELANLANNAAIGNGFGDMGSSRGQIFLDPQLPLSCYDIAPDPKLEAKALEPGVLFPPDLIECIVHKANTSGVSPMTYLRQQVPYTLRTGKINGEAFDLESIIPTDVKTLAEMKRKPADDGKEVSPVDALIKLFLKDSSTCYQLWSRAKAAGITNKAYLVLLVDAIVEGATLKEKLADSKEAMIEYEKVKKKKFLFQDVLGHLG